MKMKPIKKVSTLVICFIFLSTSSMLTTAFNISDDDQLTAAQKNLDTEKTATIYFKQYNATLKRMTQEAIGTISVEDAYKLRDALYAVENQYDSSQERIRAQIEILSHYAVLPETISLSSYQKEIERMHQTMPYQAIQAATVVPNVIICGPAVTSFLTIGGPIIPLHVLLFEILQPFWYNSSLFHYDAANGVLIATYLGIMPVVALYCTSTTLINAYGAVIGENTVISPFIALMLLHAGAGLSISVNDNGFPINIFDWAIGLSATGLIAYIDIE